MKPDYSLSHANHVSCSLCCLSAVLLLLLFPFGPVQTHAAITVTGNTSPVYDGSSDPWDVGGLLTVANDVDGTMLIDSGSSVSSAGGVIATDRGVTGAVTVTGEGSTWLNSEGLLIGGSGNGTLLIAYGGVVTNTHAGIGSGSDSNSSVTVTGVGSTWANSGSISISDGELTISEGGLVSNTEVVYIGDYTYPSGIQTGKATVTGSGSTWINSSGLLIGPGGGVGQLTIADGATMTNAEYVNIGHATSSTCELTVTGPGSTFTVERDLWIGLWAGAGGVLVENGGTLSNLEAILGYDSDASGTLTITGPNSSLITMGTYLGVWGRGELTVSAGASITGGLELGYEDDGVGVAHITGAGTTGTLGDVMVGLAGSGTMMMDDGATVNGRQGYIGKDAGATGELTVAGADTSLTFSRGFFVGQGGTGTLMIEDGAHVASGSDILSNSHTYLGANTGSVGIATVTGPDSTWTCTGYLLVGFSGSGTLTIENGGTVNSGNGFINGLGGTPGAVTISGPDSSWNNTLGLSVGEYGPGILTLVDGGHARSDGDLMIRTQGTVQGNGELGAMTVVNSGLIKPGVDDAGEILITGDYTQDTGGTLTIDLVSDGNVAGVDFDQLNISGAAEINGVLEISIMGGYAPAVGDRFDILTASSITGGFTGVNVLPGMSVVYSSDRITLVIEQQIGDLNADGFVGLADLDTVLDHWNTNVPAGSWIQGDPSGDGYVGIDDLDQVLNHWNAGTPPEFDTSYIPEPATTIPWMLFMAGVAKHRRSRTR